jgi:type VI secretion system protein VasG
MATSSKAADLKSLIGKLDPDAIRYFQGATSLAVTRTHFEITPDHLLMRMLDDSAGDVNAIINTFNVDRSKVRRAVQRVLDQARTGHTGKPVLAPTLVELLQSASLMAEQYDFEQIRSGHLMLAFALNPGHTRAGEFTPELERIDVDQLRDNFYDIVLGSSAGEPRSDGAAGPGGGAPGAGGALEQFTVDLTAKAAAGQIDPVFGRDHEIRQMIDIFSRRRKNNPIMVGEPGTGKTAIVEGFALRIIKGDVPPFLQGIKLLSLDLGLLQAGASVKGEFENRLKNVIKEIKASETPIITFIDEAHMLIGAGGSAGGGDASNLLKPALARGELRTVAATTWAEYKKYFEKDAALERRFQLVRCDEPTAESATVMLRGLKEKYEKHHKVIMLDDAVVSSVNLSKRYISGRFLPDKAVDLLDTACGRVNISMNTRPSPLEELDRKVSYLDTAVNAMKRDHDSGIAIDDEALQALQSERESLIAKMGKLEEKWKTELEAAGRVRELRSALHKKMGISTEAEGKREKVGSHDGDEAKAEEKPKEGAESSASEAELRQQIDAAMEALKEIQGETPLVHPHVDSGAVASVVADWTGIPVGKMVKDDAEATLKMEDRLRERVVGQDHALKIVAEKLRIGKAGLGNPDQPLGVFLLVGPSGTGKTELAMTVADILFGGDKFLTAINMSEFMEAHTVSQLKGSPPGYVGYGEGGVLTNAVRQQPYSVVLLDEIEKAHQDVMNLFYQVFDKGSLADGEGRVVNFRNTVIFMTSNLGTDVIQGMCESGEDINIDDLKEAVYPHLREYLKPALVARMTVIPYLTLGNEILQDIARIKVRKVAKRLAAAHKMTLEVGDEVYANIASRCQQVDIGARQIDHVLDLAILPQMSRELLGRMGDEEMPRKIVMGVTDGGEFSYSFEN